MLYNIILLSIWFIIMNEISPSSTILGISVIGMVQAIMYYINSKKAYHSSCINSVAAILSTFQQYLSFSKLYYRVQKNFIAIQGYISYILWLLKEVCFSAIGVVKIIWTPKMKIRPAFDNIVTIQTSEYGRVLYANSITLTPGTFTVDIEENRLLVHSLVKQDIWSQEMDKKVRKIIGL